MFYLPRPSAKGHNGIIRCETTSELSFQTTSTKKKEKKRFMNTFFVLFSRDQCIDIDGYVYMVNSTDLCNKLAWCLVLLLLKNVERSRNYIKLIFKEIRSFVLEV